MSKSKNRVYTSIGLERAIMAFRARQDQERRDTEDKRRVYDPKASALTGAYDKGKGKGGWLSWNWMRRFGRGGVHTSRAGVRYA